MLFSDVLGQEEVKSHLVEAVNNKRISHAQLFAGDYGYGGLALAIAYSRFIMCLNRSAADSCGICSSCVKINKLAHPDLHFSMPVNTPESKGKSISTVFIEPWREIVLESPYFSLDDWHVKIDLDKKQSLIKVDESQEIIQRLSLKTFESKYKIQIIWGAEKMNVQAANKLLKLIEEPTDNTIIILLAEDKDQLLKTILSRTQTINLPPIATSKLEEYTRASWNLNQEQIKTYAQLANGSIIRLKELIDRNEEDQYFFQLLKEWMRACYEVNIEKIYRWVEEVSSAAMGREKQKRFLEYLLEIIREAIIRNYTEGELKRFFNEEDQFLKKFAPFIISENILELNELINQAHYHISRNAYAKVLFMDLSMKFANLLRAKNRTFVR